MVKKLKEKVQAKVKRPPGPDSDIFPGYFVAKDFRY